MSIPNLAAIFKDPVLLLLGYTRVRNELQYLSCLVHPTAKRGGAGKQEGRIREGPALMGEGIAREGVVRTRRDCMWEMVRNLAY